MLALKTYLASHIADILLYLSFFFAPINPLLFTVIVLTASDTITGIIASRKRGDKIDSRKMERTISKMVLFSIAICISHLMEIRFFDWLPVTNIVAGYIAVTEFKSNMENISSYAGIDIWKTFLEKIQSLKK